MSVYSCFGLNFLPRIGNGDTYTLTLSMPNYLSYHYKLWISIDIGIIDSPDDDDNDRVEIFDGSY